MGKLPTRMVISTTLAGRDVSFCVDRTELGLNLHAGQAGVLSDAGSLYKDDMFVCTASEISSLIQYASERRPDVFRRLENGDETSILIPEASPPTIRIIAQEMRTAFFNLGELVRWMFLINLPELPFKHHQLYGVEWLCKTKAGILADDMGMGKTLQAISALDQLLRGQRIRNCLIVCPKTLVGNWEAEFKIWKDHLCVVALHRTIASRVWQAVSSQSHVTIVNYEAIRNSPPPEGAFDLIIYDEVHRLKNPKSQNYSIARELKPKIAWGLSGTPIENNAKDLTSILHILDPTRVSFSDHKLPETSIRALASRYLLRRTKEVLETALPPLVETMERVPLSVEQKASYREVIQNAEKAVDSEWIAQFNLLRDICDMDPKTGRSTKIDRALILLDAIKSLGEKAVVFSYRLPPLDELNRKLVTRYGRNEVSVLTGSVKSVDRSDLVSMFQSNEKPFVMLCSTKASAEGITLTAANHVLFINEWWNPSLNLQARDRVNRIGQERPVHVYRFRSQGTIESRLDEILARKTALFHSLITRINTYGSLALETIPKDLAQALVQQEKEIL